MESLALPATKVGIQTPVPPSLTVGSASFVTLVALDVNNDPATTGLSFSVTVTGSGSAIGGGTVSLASGTAQVIFTDTVAETVTLSMTTTASIDVSDTDTIVFGPGLSRLFHRLLQRFIL
jgi:hypothetical protein